MLSQRRQLVLRKVVDGFLASGEPVASAALSRDPELTWSASTLRSELAGLESDGLLAHPHTSAGRQPTDAGYRYYVDNLLSADLDQAPAKQVAIQLPARRELDDAVRETTEAIANATDLLAVVTAPSLASATVRHVELIELQPQILMVVVIASTGDVTKRIFEFSQPLDSGLIGWAASYMNERLAGLAIGSRQLLGRLRDAELGSVERSFIDRLATAFVHFNDLDEGEVYYDGTARLIAQTQSEGVSALNELIDMLERRAAVLELLRETLAYPQVQVRIGAENVAPQLQSMSMVTAGYGLPQRSLGTVSVIGPTRMDYGTAILAVRTASNALSRVALEVYS